MSDDLPAISMANTKQEMLSAYQAMKRLIAQKEHDLLDVRRERDGLRRATTAAVAERSS